MGLTISAASFTGMTINSVDQLRMHHFGNNNAAYVDGRIVAARKADQVVVAVDSAFEQVKASAGCERINSCVSRKGNGGEGLTYFTLKSVALQIGTVLAEAEGWRRRSG